MKSGALVWINGTFARSKSRIQGGDEMTVWSFLPPYSYDRNGRRLRK